MTTQVPSISFSNPDAYFLGDKMDVASSPYLQPDDVDVELDSVRESSVLEDEMLDEPSDIVDRASESMNDFGGETIPDDDMLDENEFAGTDIVDYNMDALIDQSQHDDNGDEEILYEEEDDEETVYNVDESTNPPLTLDDANTGSNDGTTNLGHSVQHDDLQHAGSTELDHPIPTPANPDQEDANQPDLDANAAPPTHPEQVEAIPLDNQTTPHQENKVQDSPHADINDNHDHQPPVDSAYQNNEQSHQDLHPVTLFYLEEEMSLFPPSLSDESSVFFLSETSLAFEPLDKLLIACREVLTGTLEHHDELVLDIPGLGLHIAEDSKHASEITLAQILDVYLTLCHNDSGQETHPLYCQLSSRVSLASQYSYLLSAGADGKTYSEIAADHEQSPFDEAQDETLQSDLSQEAVESHQIATTDEAQEPFILSEGINEEGLAVVADLGVEAVNEIDDHLPEQDNPSINANTDAAAETSSVTVSAEATGTADEVEETLDDGEPLDKEDLLEPLPQATDANDTLSEQNVASHEVPNDDSIQVAPEDIGDEVVAVTDDAAEIHDDPDASNDYGQEIAPIDTAPAQAVDDEIFGDEELFAHDEDDDIYEDPNPGEHDDQKDSEDPARPSTLNGRSPPHGQQALVDNNTTSSPPTSGNRLPASSHSPITPSKHTLSKRKAEAEDDLDFLDISTPEPKRRRPS